jgi:hypothetical protein
MRIDRNVLFLIIGGLLVTSAVLGYFLYQEREKPKDGFSINIGGSGISVGKK